VQVLNHQQKEIRIMKKVGGILFLVCSIASIVIAFVAKSQTSLLGILSVVAVVGAIMTGSSGIWYYIAGTILTYLGAKGIIPGGATVNTVCTYAGQVINIIAIIVIWRDAIQDLFKK
jgi:hypothetical protein